MLSIVATEIHNDNILIRDAPGAPVYHVDMLLARGERRLTGIAENPSNEDTRLLWRLKETSVEGRATPYAGKSTSRRERMFSFNAFKLRTAVAW